MDGLTKAAEEATNHRHRHLNHFDQSSQSLSSSSQSFSSILCLTNIVIMISASSICIVRQDLMKEVTFALLTFSTGGQKEPSIPMANGRLVSAHFHSAQIHSAQIHLIFR